MIFTSSAFCDQKIYNDVTEILKAKYGDTGIDYIEMSAFHSSFLTGLLKAKNPKKVCEVGVAAGGTTAIILKTLRETGSSAECISVDLNTHYHLDHKKKTGFLVDELCPELKSGWKFLAGHCLPVYLESIGGDIDFAILDTAHILPGELLDFIVILPYLSKNATIVFHDTHLHYFSQFPSYATKVTLDTAVGEKVICVDPSNEYKLPMISALTVTDDTYKYIDNSFSALTMPWGYIPHMEELSAYHNSIRKNYGNNYAEYFDYIISCALRKRQIDNNVTSIPFENKQIDLFYHPHNCGENTGERTTERSVELALSKKFINNVNNNLIEIGAVTPYYFNTNYQVVDPYDEHPSVTDRKSLFEIDIHNKNILCISVLEHIGTQDYAGICNNEDPIKAFKYLTENANKFLITIPIGYNSQLQEYIFKNSIKNAKIIYYYRSLLYNDWKYTTDFKKLYTLNYGPKWANSLAIIYRF